MISKKVKIAIAICSIAAISCVSAMAYPKINTYRYEKSLASGSNNLKDGKYEEAIEDFEKAVKLNSEDEKASKYLEVAKRYEEADKYCDNGDYTKALECINEIDLSGIDEDVVNNLKSIDGKIDENVVKENDVYAKLLKNEKWLNTHAEYKDHKDSIKFLPIDLGNDGVQDLLLYHEGKSGLAGLTLSVITYDKENMNLIIRDINVGHGGYAGYLKDEDTIVASYMHMGYARNIGYKLEGNEYKNAFTTDDDTGSFPEGMKEPTYKINDKKVSADEYKKYVEEFQSKLENKEMYELNDENIKEFLNINGEIDSSDEEIEKYIQAKVKTSDEAMELIKKNDSAFMEKLNISEVKFVKMITSSDIVFSSYRLGNEEYYMFDAIEGTNAGSGDREWKKYLVGKSSGNIYMANNQGGANMYMIKDNKIVETKTCGPINSDWRKE